MSMLASRQLYHTVTAAFKYKPKSRSLATMTGTTHSLLNAPSWAANFPKSTAKPSSTMNFVGVTPQTTATVRRVLTENDHGYDMYEQHRRYAHNHFAHSTLTRYCLGAPSALLQADWEHDRQNLGPLDCKEGGREKEAGELPDKITKDNWLDKRWFGRRGSYSRYIVFFHEEVGRLGIEGAVEEYLFSESASGGKDGPGMLPMLMAGVVHPFIQLGFGLEFDDKIIVAEGLALTCLHNPSVSSKLFPVGWPQTPLAKPKGPSRPLLSLFAEFCEDPRLDPGPFDDDVLINDRLRNSLTEEHIACLHDLVARWDLGDMSDAMVCKRVEEAAWFATLLTGATSRPGYERRVDFFLMHCLTSSLFFPAYCKRLSPEKRHFVFQSWLLTVFHILLARGRPKIFIDEVMSYTDSPQGPLSHAADGKLACVGKPGSAEQANPWLGIIDNALVAIDSHVPKTIRALLYYAQEFGGRQAGEVPGTVVDGKEILPGGAKLDGTLFVRVAGTVMDVLGWTKEGGPRGEFDRSALGWDEAWQHTSEELNAHWTAQ